jgi:tetratricopeptide (TPR) repeat protein
MPRKPKKTARSSIVVIEAFGEPDDHLRLSTLIADVVTKADGVTKTLDPAAAAALRGVARRLTDDRGPRSWRDRRTDFIDVTRLMPSGTVVLRDPDAFAKTYTFDSSEDWDDATLCRERGDFFESLMDPIARGAIELERTAPDPRFSKRLANAAVSVKDSHGDPADPYASLIGPDAHGALGWLLQKDHLTEDAVDELIEGGTGPELDRHLLLVTYDHLLPATRAAAYRLAVLRGEQALNGAIGPFAVQTKPAAAAVTRDQIDDLLSCGFLRRTTADGRVRMPRIVRDVVLVRADAENPGAVAKDHKLAFAHLEQFDEPSHIASMIERHHHAVRGLLVKQAIATARFYATDLRELAIRLSNREQWSDAAAVYREIVKLDPADAYAWEYLGYNLVRAQRQPKKHVDEILKAYGMAHEIEPANPLYHGRLLGFRGRIGHDIRAEFAHWMGIYTWNGVDRFASEVLKGLRRGNHDPVAKRLIATYRWLLKHPEVKHIMDKEWGRSPN